MYFSTLKEYIKKAHKILRRDRVNIGISFTEFWETLNLCRGVSSASVYIFLSKPYNRKTKTSEKSIATPFDLIHLLTEEYGEWGADSHSNQ
uniref:Uncharacterized protein n=1 Tax=Helianthus annuus TaxID=4232 RepID=A0A251U7I7_HELAN